MRILPAGPSALLVEVEDTDAVLALHAEIERRRALGWCPSLIDVVPAARTVLLDGLGSLAARDAVARDLPTWRVPPVPAGSGPEISIDVVYDGDDLLDVARLWGVETDEVVALHTGAEHTVAFCGFSPGFAYLSGLPRHLSVSRRRTPRAEVPAGAVGLAGSFTGVYPRPSPGGWQLIGRTDAVLWDTSRDPAALLTPRTRVRFRAVDP